MATVFKCKMCGAALSVEENMTVCTCKYCGIPQTLPKLDDEKRLNMYDRANHFRRNSEFDKAEAIYEQILNEDNTDSEAYWSLVLCRYGIEYVEEASATHRRMITVNRAQFTSVFDDDNYKSALQYADIAQRQIYEKEAKIINEIQKKILAISQQEEPFDVFICYKENDKNGQRTKDSVLAMDLYNNLTKEGYKVFFARATLEKKLGVAYEPYIFAALNSAKVMVVIGSTREYLDAVWVKNEWKRYLALIKNGADKVLIPAYIDMDPYDLPEEFSHLQAQNMAKIGFMQDLMYGIKKIVGKDDDSAESNDESDEKEIRNYIKRIFMFLEDNDFINADLYCEKVLDMDPENVDAYLGKLLVDIKVSSKEHILESKIPLASNNNYKKLCRFGSEELVRELTEYNKQISGRLHFEKLVASYTAAVTKMQTAVSINDFQNAINMFDECRGFRNADKLVEQCNAHIKYLQKQLEDKRIQSLKTAKKQYLRRLIPKFIGLLVLSCLAIFLPVSSMILFACLGDYAIILCGVAGILSMIICMLLFGIMRSIKPFRDKIEQINQKIGIGFSRFIFRIIEYIAVAFPFVVNFICAVILIIPIIFMFN